MYRKFFFLLAAAAIFLSSCSLGGESQPSISLEDIQATAQSSALTAVAQTQIVPTEIPPTNTPEPTPEPVVVVETVIEKESVVDQSAELQPVIVVEETASVSSSASSGGKCSRLTSDTKGRKVFIRIENVTHAPVTFSSTLYETPLGSCGSTSVNLEKRSETVIEVPEGCYFLYAWINDPKKPVTKSLEVCVNQDRSKPEKIIQKWRIEKEMIKAIGY
ncbi:MAG: hypothetical protein QY332_10325 [Anaerolineales bacterium]|nr:MAG: hypothetical protein QY332_10325 [Anaerolineales bacterium]